MELSSDMHLILVSLLSILGSVLSQNSVCSSLQFRNLGAELQNEHQCMLLEKIQQDMVDSRSASNKQFNQLVQLISSIELRLQRHSYSSRRGNTGLVKGFPSIKGTPIARDCYELYRNGFKVSGVYPIKLPKGNVLNVWCDMTDEKGGWTVIQRRLDGSWNFTRDWDDYAFGFGNVNTEYYFGNENIHQITKKGNYSLRIELTDWENKTAYAQYDHFSIDGEEADYRLHVSGYNGTAGDAFNEYHDGMRFTTIDNDNDEWHSNCALKDQAGWWYRACGFSSLNGIYIRGGKIDTLPGGLIRGIIWYHWKNDYGYSMQKTVMKIKPLVAINMEKENIRKKEREERLGLTEEEEDLLEIGIRRIIGKELITGKQIDLSEELKQKKEKEEREKLLLERKEKEEKEKAEKEKKEKEEKERKEKEEKEKEEKEKKEKEEKEVKKPAGVLPKKKI